MFFLFHLADTVLVKKKMTRYKNISIKLSSITLSPLSVVSLKNLTLKSLLSLSLIKIHQQYLCRHHQLNHTTKDQFKLRKYHNLKKIKLTKECN